MTVDLETASAVIRPRPGRVFDPVGIPPAVDKAGFDAPRVEFDARGRLEKQPDGSYLLRIEGIPHAFRLSLPDGSGPLENGPFGGRFLLSDADAAPPVVQVLESERD